MSFENLVVDNRSYRVGLSRDAWTGGWLASYSRTDADPNPLEAVAGTSEAALERMRSKIRKSESTRRT